MKCAGPAQDGWPVTEHMRATDFGVPCLRRTTGSSVNFRPGAPVKFSSRHRRLHESRHKGAGRRTLSTASKSAVCPPLRVQPDLALPYSFVDELPSVAMTQRFLALCEHHGSQHLAVKLVAVGRSTGVQGLPQSDDWTAWNAREMRAAVEYLERLRVR